MQKIIILGDSTGSSIGRNSKVWSRLLSERKIWSSNIELIDTTCPGNTASSSLLTLIIHVLKSPKHIAAVILYVGNCDRITRPYQTNKFTFFGILNRYLRYRFNFGKTKRYEWNKLTPYEWNEKINKNLEITPDIKDFAKMLKYIKFICIVFKIKLIVVIPKSNHDFTPGTAKGNFLYYNTLGYESNWKSLEKSGLYEVLNCDPDLDFDTQISNIKSLINLSSDAEKIYCAINNYAVNLANSGKLFEAKILLGALLNDDTQRVEIFLYNLSRIEYLLGNLESSSTLLDLSVSRDRSSYRIDKLYSDKIQEVMSKNRNVELIDLRDTPFQHSFLDHCHLTPEGQFLLAEKLEAELKKILKPGEFAINLTIDILNPEIINCDFREWRIFFGIFQDQSKEILVDQNKIDELFDNLSKFPHSITASLVPEEFQYESIDFGKFPEFFVSKMFLMLTDARSFSNLPEMQKKYNQDVFELERLFAYLNVNHALPKGAVLSYTELEKLSLQICKSVCAKLLEISKAPISKNLRLKTIMYWYFRESMMFGFQSDINSVYDRESFRRIFEALFLAYSYIEGTNSNLDTVILDLISFSINFEVLLADINALNRNENEVSDRLRKYIVRVEMLSNDLGEL